MSLDTTLPPLRFHNIHSKNITLSQDGTIAKRTDDFGFVFTSRPILVDEKVTVKFMEVSNRKTLASAFCFGITHKDPFDTAFEDIRNYTYLDLIKKMDFVAVPLEKKLCERNTILEFMIPTSNQLVYEVNGEKKHKSEAKIRTETAMWAVIYFFENPVSIKLIKNLTPKVSLKEKEEIKNSKDAKVTHRTQSFFPQLKNEKNVTDNTKVVPQSTESSLEVEERRVSVFGVKLKQRASSSSIQEHKSECTICCEKEPNAVLYKCAHMCMCYECAMEQWKGRGDGRCPLCRNIIEDVIKPYK